MEQFFKKWQEVMKGASGSLSITPIKDKQVVSFTPNVKSHMKPLTVTGTPEELEEGFFKLMEQTMEIAEKSGIISNIEDIATSTEKAPVASKPKSAKKSTAKNTEPIASGEAVKDEYCAEEIEGLKKKNTPTLEKLLVKEGMYERKKDIIQGILEARKSKGIKAEQKTPDAVDTTARQLEIKVPLKHSPEDIRDFKTILDNRLSQAMDDRDFAKRTIDRGLFNNISKEIAEQTYNDALSDIEQINTLLLQCEDGTIGTCADGTLVPKEEVLNNLKK